MGLIERARADFAEQAAQAEFEEGVTLDQSAFFATRAAELVPDRRINLCSTDIDSVLIHHLGESAFDLENYRRFSGVNKHLGDAIVRAAVAADYADSQDGSISRVPVLFIGRADSILASADDARHTSLSLIGPAGTSRSPLYASTVAVDEETGGQTRRLVIRNAQTVTAASDMLRDTQEYPDGLPVVKSSELCLSIRSNHARTSSEAISQNDRNVIRIDRSGTGHHLLVGSGMIREFLEKQGRHAKEAAEYEGGLGGEFSSAELRTAYWDAFTAKLNLRPAEIDFMSTIRGAIAPRVSTRSANLTEHAPNNNPNKPL